MTRIKAAVLALLMLAMGFFLMESTAQAKPPSLKSILFMTEQYPPFNFLEKGNLQGISVDLLELILKKTKAGFSRDAIQFGPWADGYQKTLNVQDTALFSTTRTPERESLFKWVGPIAPTRIVLFTRKDRSLNIQSPDDLKALKIGAITDDIGEQLCLKAGVQKKDMILSENADSLVELLETGKIDAWAYEETAGRWFINNHAEGAGDFTTVYVLYEGELYYAFNRLTDESVIKTIQSALDDIKKEKDINGFSPYEQIFDRYMKPRYIEDKITYLQMQTLTDDTAKAIAKDTPAALQLITLGLSPYRDSENPALYVFVFDIDVNIVADAENAKMVWKNFKGKTDVSGKAYRDDIVTGALKNGKGWVDYVSTHPARSGLYYKTTYYRLVEGSDGMKYIVCCGKLKNKP
jgi:polar amino acid transport system substrate-binding protein